MQIIFLDTETTDLEPERRLVQLAYKIPSTGKTVNEYFKPAAPISFGAMAVHHITSEMVADKPAFIGSTYHAELAAELSDKIVVAHNAPFDLTVLKNEGIITENYIDTLRVARHCFIAEQYTLQFLRYFLGLTVTAAAHDALGDVLVLEALFEYLKKAVAEKYGSQTEEGVQSKMIELTHTPTLLITINFGKYRGKMFEEVVRIDRAYLDWLRGSELQKSPAEQNEELVFTLNHFCK